MTIWGLPTVNPAIRKSESMPLNLALMTITYVLLVALYEWPAYGRVLGIDFKVYVTLVALHTVTIYGAFLTRNLPENHGLVRFAYALTPFWVVAVYACFFDAFAQPVTGAVGVLLSVRRSDGAFVWPQWLADMPQRGVSALGCAGLGASLGARQPHWSGVCDGNRRAHYLHPAGRQDRASAALASGNEQARLAEERRRGEAERLRLAADVEARLWEAIARADSEASAAEVASSSTAVSSALDVLSDELQEVLYELRAAVWSLDPDDAPWTTIESHCRRLASSLAGPSCALEFSVPGEAVLSAAGRVNLLRLLRTLFRKDVVRTTIKPVNGGITVDAQFRSGESTHHEIAGLSLPPASREALNQTVSPFAALTR